MSIEGTEHRRTITAHSPAEAWAQCCQGWGQHPSPRFARVREDGVVVWPPRFAETEKKRGPGRPKKQAEQPAEQTPAEV